MKNNRDVRKRLRRRKIVPEQLPAAEDVKKTQRQFATEEKALRRQVQHLEPAVTTAPRPTRQLATRHG